MTTADKPRFTAAYNRLWVALRHDKLDVKERAAKLVVYWDSLIDLPIEAVEQAERSFRQEGSDWFPTTTEWADHARECEILLLEQSSARLALPPSKAAKRAELERAEAGRAAFVEACRAMGYHWLAEYVAAIELKHPSESTRPVVCALCLDAGVVAREVDGVRVALACDCREVNPRVKRRAFEARRALAGRKQLHGYGAVREG